MDILLPRTPGPDDRIPPFADIQALVEQAVVAEVPEFASWTEAERTRWKISKVPAVDEIKERIRCLLVARATGTTPEDIAKANNRVLSSPDTTLTDLAGPLAPEYANAVSLAMDGIGADHFFLNEHFHDGEDLSHFRTVGDWDRDDHAYQQDARAKDFGTEPQPYQGSLYAEWGRCVVDGRFAYMGLHMAHYYVASDMEEHGRDLIQTLVPSRFKANPDHGQKTAQGTIWSMEKDAGGLEDVLKALEKAMDTHIQDTTQRLADKACANPTPEVWLIRSTDAYTPAWETHYEAIFLNPEAVDRVRWTSFLSDIATMAGDEAELAAVVARETQTLHDLLNSLYEQLMVGRTKPDPVSLPPSDAMFPDLD